MTTTPKPTSELLNLECVVTILNNKGDTIARIRGKVQINNSVYSVRPKPFDGSLDTVVWLKEISNVDFATYVFPNIVVVM